MLDVAITFPHLSFLPGRQRFTLMRSWTWRSRDCQHDVAAYKATARTIATWQQRMVSCDASERSCRQSRVSPPKAPTKRSLLSPEASNHEDGDLSSDDWLCCLVVERHVVVAVCRRFRSALLSCSTACNAASEKGLQIASICSPA